METLQEVTSAAPSYTAHTVVDSAPWTLCGKQIGRNWLRGRVLVKRDCSTCDAMKRKWHS